MAAGVNLQVCASDPCDGADIDADLCFSFHQLLVPVTEGEESSKREHPTRVCVHVMMVSPLVYCVPVAMKAREETPKFGGAKSDTDIFGPLKFALGNISAFCANSTVRLQSPAHNHHFTISHDFQETTAVGNKLSNLLSRIVALESCFASCPSDLEEQRGREDLIRCVTIPPLLPVSFPLESLRPSGNNCRCFPRSRG